jgi:hypothetical protein
VHANAVFDVHDVVRQTDPPTCAVGERDSTPKFIPRTGCVADPEVGPFTPLSERITLSRPAYL